MSPRPARLATRALALATLVAAVASAGCGAKGDDGGSTTPEPSDPTDGGASVYGDARDDLGGFRADVPEAASGTRICSADLHTVTNDRGERVETCPPDQGCLAGACVPACAAAAGSHGSVGCDFLVSTPSFLGAIAPPCFAIFVANNWSTALHVSVARGGKSYDVRDFGRVPTAKKLDAADWPAIDAAGVAPNEVGVLFMSADPSSQNFGHSLACPVPAAIDAGSPQVVGSGKGDAWHVVTDVPVSAYDIMPYGGARSFLPSATLLYPTSAWGKNYVAVVPSRERPFGGSSFQQWGQVVAAQADTTVTIVPTSPLPAAGTVPAIGAGTGASFTLGAGEFIQWDPSGNMSGSILSSDKPIAFIGGSELICLRSATGNEGGCDSAHQQGLPVSALGSAYVGVPYASRRADLAPESIPYRLVGAASGTRLLFDPPIDGAPTALELGQTVDFETERAFAVTSQDENHPFVVAQMMTGGGTRAGAMTPPMVAGGTSLLGDEDHVDVLPPAQFLSRYVFFTDPTYGTTNLTLTRVKQPRGFSDVTIDCVGVVKGWKPVGAGGVYEVTDVDLVRYPEATGTCANGVHVASSAGAFGLTVWGLDSYASYGYPAGGNLGTINSVVVSAVPK